MKHYQENYRFGNLQRGTKFSMLIIFLIAVITTQAQTSLRENKTTLINRNGIPDKVFIDASGYEVLQYVVKESHTSLVNILPEQINFYLKNDSCKKKENTISTRYYTLQTRYFDRSYTCADDLRSAAWITNYHTFYRMKVNGAFAVYTEETFEL